MKATNKFKEKFSNPLWRLLIALGLFLLIIGIWQYFYSPPGQKIYKVDYSTFLSELKSDNIDSVTLEGLQASGKFRNTVNIEVTWLDEPLKVLQFETRLPEFQGEGLIEELRDKGVDVQVLPSQKDSVFWSILSWLLPLGVIILLWMYIMRRTTRQMGGGPGGMFSFGESRAKAFDMTEPSITFDDVAGMDNVKQELDEVIRFLKNPSKYQRVGAKVPKGVLLMGPPGTGKTLLARAVAGEAGVPFYSISASEFIEMFVGVGASRVRDMFRKAKASKPSIVFIDEIDAVGRTRGTGLGGGHDEREQTLNQLLSELDGFEPNEGIIVMAATNRPDVLDPALLRPGRFDRRLVVDNPGWKERLEILKIHVRNKKLFDDVDLESIARATPGMTGADLENLANEAALIAIRHDREVINMADFDEAKDKILMGTVRQDTISELERKITACHEAGHTLVAWRLPYADPIHKVSILPRGQAMGVTQLLPEEDRHFYPKRYLLDQLAVALGGRVAESLVFNDISTGAQNDLKNATQLAEKMVAQWGMSEKVGPINLPRGEEHPFLGRELASPKHYSDDMAWMMDQEIRDLVVKAENRAREILAQEKDALERLLQILLEEETLDSSALEEMLGAPAHTKRKEL